MTNKNCDCRSADEESLMERRKSNWPDYEDSIAQLRASFWAGAVAGSSPDTKLLQGNEYVIPNPERIATSLHAQNVGKTSVVDSLFALGAAATVKRAKPYVLPDGFNTRAPLSPFQQLMRFGYAEYCIDDFAREKLSRVLFDSWKREAFDRVLRRNACQSKTLTCLSCGRTGLGVGCPCGA
ncbi:hypothetical protein Nazgul25 [Burkholderia phage BcepNazgul]|uniref:Uncharacterized protein n=1 Tax=Burkholderia phage BcepNazgul TaxID=242861 RepID=Q6UYL5_9CAUD|nr:hypothetical protein Nazgul25 [Burkholderia phage BcepNazgul]AAQ63326.1 hypothetical protein Nazgul25 [Burkholderia phage BcepNazgul]